MANTLPFIARFRSRSGWVGAARPPSGRAEAWREARAAGVTPLLIAIAAAAAGALVHIAVSWFTGGATHQALPAASLVTGGLLALAGYRGLALSGRTRRLQRDRLEALTREKRSAESANHAKSRYLATISHEIRSPLNAIYGYAQLMERDEGVSPREAATVIRRCAEQLNTLVEGLLDISQLENATLRVKPDVVALAPFLEQIVSMFRPAAATKGLTFRYEAAGPLPRFVRMDQSRLRQVLINLLSNAIKFTDTGSVTLRVSYRGQMARFEIADTGPGIAAEDRERIFDPFERALPEAQAPRPGVGLGLALSKAMVDILGGKLELRSEPGVGTVFEVTLMLANVAGKLEHTPAVRHVVGYAGPRRSIIVADDDPEQLSFLVSLLHSLGFEVTPVPDGETALARCADQPFDLAILDISMPGISGWDTAVQLRERMRQDVRILMLSANSQEFHKPDFPRPVHDLFLVKPVEFGALIEAIGGLLNMSWTWAEAEPMADASERLWVSELNEAAKQRVSRIGELLRIGHVRGLEHEIGQLAAEDPRAQPLAARLIDSLDRFDLAEMAQSLEQA